MKLSIRPLALAALGVLASSAWANPTNLAPKNPLQAHGIIKGVRAGCEDAKATVKRLYEAHDAMEPKAAKFDEEKSNPQILPHLQLAKDHSQYWVLNRDAKHLILMGEPAGHDLDIKLARLTQKLAGLARVGAGPELGRLKQQIITKLRNDTKRRERILDQAQQKIASGQLEAAERALEGFGVELWQYLTFLSPTERGPFLKRFQSLISDCDTKLSAKQRANYLQQAKQVMAENMEGVEFFNNEAKRIRSELAASGTAKIGDKQTADAADAIEYLSGLWGSASAGLLRNCAIRWAFVSESDYESGSSSASQATSESIKPVKQLVTSAQTAIASVIESAAAKTPADGARALYARILEKLAFIDRRMGTSEVSRACEPALQKLAARDPALPKQIEAYERATSEVLRWRKSFASQQASTFRKGYMPSLSKNTQKVRITQSLKPKMYGAFTASERPLLPPSFAQPASWSVYEAAPFVVKAKVYSDRTLRISPNSRTSVVPYGSHQYANVAVGFDLQKEVDALRAALNVDDEHPALSLAAAGAISSAQLREFESVGGEIQKVHLEAVVTRFIALPDPAYMLADLGSLPAIDDRVPPTRQTCWRFDIQPHWVQHEYFTFAAPTAMK